MFTNPVVYDKNFVNVDMAVAWALGHHHPLGHCYIVDYSSRISRKNIKQLIK
jgi:hypothetical protein